MFWLLRLSQSVVLVVDMVVWIKPKDLAEKLGVSPQSVTKQIRKWREEGALVDTDCQFRGNAVVMVSEAKYLHLKNRNSNPNMLRDEDGQLDIRDDVSPGALSSGDTPLVDEEGLKEAKRRDAWLTVEMRELALAEKKGRLVSVEKLEASLIAVGRGIQAKINRIENKTEDFEAALEQDGSHGLRVVLREFAFELNNEIFKSLMAIAKEASETDELEELDT